MDKEKRPLRSLDEIAKRTHIKQIGEQINFTPDNGYYDVTFRQARNYNLNNGKICKNLSFKGAKQPVSYGYFKSRASFNSRFKLTRKHGNHYGEYLASIILKQLEIPACKVDIGIYNFRHPYKAGAIIPLEGALSHYQLTQEENFIPLNVIAQNFRSAKRKKYSSLLGEKAAGGSGSSSHYTNIEVILASIEALLIKEGQEAKIPEVRKQIFNMCLFDIKFANRDRHDENFGLKINQVTNEVQFYELFDNEQILGLQLPEVVAEEAVKDDKKFQELKRKEFTSCIGIPGQPQKIPARELFKYLLEKYPSETMEAYKNVSRYTLDDLKNLIDIATPDMPEGPRALAYKIFEDREKEMEETLQAYNKSHTIPDDNTLDEY